MGARAQGREEEEEEEEERGRDPVGGPWHCGNGDGPWPAARHIHAAAVDERAGADLRALARLTALICAGGQRLDGHRRDTGSGFGSLYTYLLGASRRKWRHRVQRRSLVAWHRGPRSPDWMIVVT